MSLSERARNFLLFFGGVFLGIVGNLFAEVVMAYRYPGGVIPSKTAIALMVILLAVMACETIVVYIYTVR